MSISLRLSDWQIFKKSIILTLMMLILLGAESNIHANGEKLKFDHVFDLGSPGGQTMLQDNDGKNEAMGASCPHEFSA